MENPRVVRLARARFRALLGRGPPAALRRPGRRLRPRQRATGALALRRLLWAGGRPAQAGPAPLPGGHLPVLRPVPPVPAADRLPPVGGLQPRPRRLRRPRVDGADPRAVVAAGRPDPHLLP